MPTSAQIAPATVIRFEQLQSPLSRSLAGVGDEFVGVAREINLAANCRCTATTSQSTAATEYQ